MRQAAIHRPTEMLRVAAVSTFAMLLAVADGRAGTSEDRATGASPAQDPPLKVSFKWPQERGNVPLVLTRRAKLRGVVQVKRTGKVEPQEKLIIQFIRERDRAFAGQFLAERKQVGPDLFEYEAELTAPPGAALYELEATLDRARLAGPRPRASMEIKVVE